jgi:hypothetical protein
MRKRKLGGHELRYDRELETVVAQWLITMADNTGPGLISTWNWDLVTRCDTVNGLRLVETSVGRNSLIT